MRLPYGCAHYEISGASVLHPVRPHRQLAGLIWRRDAVVVEDACHSGDECLKAHGMVAGVILHLAELCVWKPSKVWIERETKTTVRIGAVVRPRHKYLGFLLIHDGHVLYQCRAQRNGGVLRVGSDVQAAIAAV